MCLGYYSDSKRATKGVAGYDRNASCSRTVPMRGKGMIQTGIAISIPDSIYARITPFSGRAVKIFIDVGVLVIDGDS